MYLIEDDHELIITKEDFSAAQEIMARRREPLQNGRKYLFSGRIICGDCGGTFCRRVVSGEVYWLCGNHIKRGHADKPSAGKSGKKISGRHSRGCAAN